MAMVTRVMHPVVILRMTPGQGSDPRSKIRILTAVGPQGKTNLLFSTPRYTVWGPIEEADKLNIHCEAHLVTRAGF